MCQLYLKALFLPSSLQPSFFLSLPFSTFLVPLVWSSLQFHVTTGFFSSSRWALICKVSTFLCVCVVWFVVVQSLFLIRPALTKLSLYCHIWALLGSRAFTGNLIQTLIVLKGWQTWLSLWLCCISPSFAVSALSWPVSAFLHSTTVSFVPWLSPRVWHKWRDVGMRGDLI